MQYLLMLYAQESGWEPDVEGRTGTWCSGLRRLYGGIESSRAYGWAPIACKMSARRPPCAWCPVNRRCWMVPMWTPRSRLGGYYLIDVSDLDAALGWAARCPGASHGTIEVRPVWSYPV